jgi:DNA-binding CsgD family transcriptional regulator/ArsR family metal-binding transcriptional regulator
MAIETNPMTRFKHFSEFSLRSSSLSLGERCWFAHFKVDGDVSHLFPFFHAVGDDVVHYASPEVLQFKWRNTIVALYPPDTVVARLFYGREQALEFAHRLIDLLNDLEARKSHIRPVHKRLARLQVPEILRFLPMTDCGKCGFKTCMAFAGALSRRKTQIMMCPEFPEPVEVRILFSTDEQDSKTIRQLSVDPDLAGVAVSMRKMVTAKAVPQPDVSVRRKRSKGIVGTREGIIFQLSVREMEVLRLIAEGFTNKEIASVLNVSQNTIKSHVVSIFNKLGINDRTLAAVWAAQNELV